MDRGETCPSDRSHKSRPYAGPHVAPLKAWRLGTKLVFGWGGCKPLVFWVREGRIGLGWAVLAWAVYSAVLDLGWAGLGQVASGRGGTHGSGCGPESQFHLTWGEFNDRENTGEISRACSDHFQHQAKPLWSSVWGFRGTRLAQSLETSLKQLHKHTCLQACTDVCTLVQ